MKRIFRYSLAWLCHLPICVASIGCSSLGFSTYPVAHFMTNQTKEVLQASPRCPQVARELAKEVMPVHYLQPGDELLVEAINDDSEIRLPADQQVSADGSLDLGKFGRVVVASLTLEEAELQIYQRLIESVEAEFTVNVRLISPVHRYYVAGEVNSPGAYPLTGYETVLDGLMAAGGLTARASACDTLLARPTDPCSCRVTLPVCYRAITQLGDTTTNYQLKPGDRIFVGRQTFCEEFFPCCSKQTCERCCGPQQACRNPRIAERTSPEFSLIESNLISVQRSAVPTDSPGTVDYEATDFDSADDQPLSDVSVHPWSVDSDPNIAQPLGADLESSRPQSTIRKAEQETQDGQLDFDVPAIPSDAE